MVTTSLAPRLPVQAHRYGVQRARKPIWRRGRRYLPSTIVTLSFSVTGSGGIVIGGTGLASQPTLVGGTNVGNTGRVRVLSSRNSVRILPVKGVGGM